MIKRTEEIKLKNTQKMLGKKLHTLSHVYSNMKEIDHVFRASQFSRLTTRIIRCRLFEF